MAEDAAASLPRLFLLGWEARRKIEACELSSGSPEHVVRSRAQSKPWFILLYVRVSPQKCLSDGVAALESATHLANQLSLFSDNEEVEEVATGTLK